MTAIRDSKGRFFKGCIGIRKGMHHTDKAISKISKAKKEAFKDITKHPRWVGDNVGYRGIHYWIQKARGRPTKCTKCGLIKRKIKKRRIQWANISGEYKRNTTDWIALCVPCHKLMDNKKRNVKNNNRFTSSGFTIKGR